MLQKFYQVGILHEPKFQAKRREKGPGSNNIILFEPGPFSGAFSAALALTPATYTGKAAELARNI